MKRIRITAAFVFIIVLILSLTACGSKSSGLSVARLGEELSQGKWSFSTNEDGSFKYVAESSVTKITYSGTADKKGNVNTITITNEEVDSSRLTDLTALKKLTSKSGGDMTMADLRAAFCFSELLSLDNLFDSSKEEFSVDSYLSEACDFFNGKSLVVNGWTITSNVNKSANTVTINAVFK